jgi:two-component system nitrogen regulation response regulator GlnG
MTQTVILADDDPSVLTVLERACLKRGYKVVPVASGDGLLAVLSSDVGDVLVTDVRMPWGGRMESSLERMGDIKERRPDLPVIVISAQTTLMTAVKAREAGAFDYLPKPFDLDVLMQSIESASKVLSANENTMDISHEVETEPNGGVIGKSAAMQQVFRVLARVVENDLTVMISGESGTGKELIAQAIHRLGARARKPFVALNMAALPRELVESELFGHEKGAFTGAVQRKAGAFERADGGTLFLDEIGDMPMEAQTRLLRVLQEGEYTAVGGVRVLSANVRIVCATHRDLLEQVRLGAFREDLYYRLNVVPIHAPPLRERKDDIPLLIEHLMQKAPARGLVAKQLSVEAMELFSAYDWPGNVRELENILYRLLMLVTGEVIEREHAMGELPTHAADEKRKPTLESAAREHINAYFEAHLPDLPPLDLVSRILPLVERPLIERTLEATKGNRIKAADLLGMNRNTLRKKMQELGIVWE